MLKALIKMGYLFRTHAHHLKYFKWSLKAFDISYNVNVMLTTVVPRCLGNHDKKKGLYAQYRSNFGGDIFNLGLIEFPAPPYIRRGVVEVGGGGR